MFPFPFASILSQDGVHEAAVESDVDCHQRYEAVCWLVPDPNMSFEIGQRSRVPGPGEQSLSRCRGFLLRRARSRPRVLIGSRSVKAHPLIMGLCLVVGSPVVSGCWLGRGSPTPAQAKERLTEAVAARDPQQLWRALDLDTQWSWMTIQRADRECYDITLSNVPEGPEREPMIKRFEAAATSEDAAALFARWLSPEIWARLAGQLAAARTQEPQPVGPDRAEITLPDGKLVFRKDDRNHFGWGYAGLAEPAEALRRIATTDREALRTNAADYERAATREQR